MSVTIAGLIVMALSKLCEVAGITMPVESLHMTANTLVAIGGGLMVWYGRVRLGDIRVTGLRL